MHDLKDISAQDLSDTIGAIYDCAITPDHWPEAMRRITGLTSSTSMGMGIIDHRQKQNVRLYEYGYAEDDLKLFFQKYAVMNPAWVARLMFPVGEPVTGEMLLDEQEFLESRVYREFLQPRGLRYGVTIEMLRTTHRSVGTTVMRTDAQRPFGPADLSLLRLLSPHLCRALTIADALDLRTLKSEMLEATLDALAAGVYLISRDGKVVYMNAAAEHQARAGHALRVVNHRLLATDPEANARLANIIDDVSRDETDAGPAGHSLALPDVNGAGYVATVLPIERGRRRSILAPFAASVAVFAQDPELVPLMPGEAFAKLYGLTGGELRVLLTLAQGAGAKEAADVLGIGEATVRTHLQRLFSKTGTSRQAELLQRLHDSRPPTTAPASEARH